MFVLVLVRSSVPGPVTGQELLLGHGTGLGMGQNKGQGREGRGDKDGGQIEIQERRNGEFGRGKSITSETGSGSYSPMFAPAQRVCVLCGVSTATVMCVECDVGFCEGCNTSFHSVGALRSHVEMDARELDGNKLLLRRDTESMISPLKKVDFRTKRAESAAFGNESTSKIKERIKQRSPGILEVEEEQDLEPPRSERDRVASLDNKQHSFLPQYSGAMLSFRLLNHGLDATPNDLRVEHPNSFLFYVDKTRRTFQIAEKINLSGSKESKLVSLFVRPLHHIKSVLHFDSDPKHFSLAFHLCRQTLECYAPLAEEAKAICDVLNLSILSSAEECSLEESILYASRGFKKGSLQWSERWLVIKRKLLLIFRTSDSTVPTNTVSLLTKAGTTLPAGSIQPYGHKVIVINAQDREYSIKLLSEKERDSFLSVLNEASLLVPTFIGNEIERVEEAKMSLSPRVKAPVPIVLNGTSSFKSVDPFASKLVTQSADRRNNIVQYELALRSTLSKMNNSKDALHRVNFDHVDYKIEFVECENHVESSYVAPPEPTIQNNISHIPYWLIKTLGTSMVDGAYLTSTFFVPKQIWYVFYSFLF